MADIRYGWIQVLRGYQEENVSLHFLMFSSELSLLLPGFCQDNLELR